MSTILKAGCRALLIKHAYNCGSCGTWKCRWYKKSYHTVCHNPERIKNLNPKEYLDCPGMLVNHKYVRKFFLAAWNGMIDDNLKKRRTSWEAVRDSKNTTALQKVRAKQMLELTERGAAAKMSEEIPEIIRMVLDRIEVIDQRYADVYFLDGTVMKVKLESEYEWE